MNTRLKSIFEDAQKLDPAERAELAELLLATVETDPGIEGAWSGEVSDRIAAHERGEISARSARAMLAKYLAE
ncbi:MAG: addiction module protein [Hyphomicrobium sp.]|uniref:addiction module protein n=1 Tax=Hyphomicrobium sp. TaxID=82 RepID=UPI003D0CCA1B